MRKAISPAHLKRIGLYVAAGLLAALIISAAALYLILRGSLPQLEGRVRVDLLHSPVTIERDAFGTPTVRAKTRTDLALATGFVHAQDRFFQMDLMRRSAAGELAALLGPALVEADRSLRVHDFRSVAASVLAAAEPSQVELLAAYAEGVNAGLRALRARPWEYLLLRTQPTPWKPEDSILAAFAMYLTLHDATGEEELAREQLRAHLPPALHAFLYPVGTEWDAPLTGGTWRMPAIPGPDLVDLGSHAATARDASERQRQASVQDELAEPMIGSNAWAVSGDYTADGAGLLANDMHLGLRLPNTWYAARLVVDGDADTRRDLVGVTLPGLPFLIAGSNGKVAWGFTNSYGDWVDLVVVERAADDPSRYLTAEGPEPFDVRTERIEVNGGAAQSIDVRRTRWGPIVRQDARGRWLALQWTAHHARATNLHMLEFETASSLPELFEAANRAGGPVQNIVAVDARGSVGWSLMGQIPMRPAADATVPLSWREAGWSGWREPAEYPRFIDPPGGRVWSANQRMIDAAQWFELVGEGRYDLGARAAQIRDALRALPRATPADFVALQLDDRALFLARWRDLLLATIESLGADDARYREAYELVRDWSGRAAADDVGYRIVRAFRDQVRAEVFHMLTASARAYVGDTALQPAPQFEGPLWMLVTQRPPHLLGREHESWDSLLAASLDATLARLRQACASLRECAWGKQNTLSMRHPLATALPQRLARWLDMPADQMDGDVAMPRVQSPSFGASMRLVVAPGREQAGLIQLPGGPVDHPLSPFYGAGHAQWVRGEPRPILPGMAQHRLTLAPIANKSGS